MKNATSLILVTRVPDLDGMVLTGCLSNLPAPSDLNGNAMALLDWSRYKTPRDAMCAPWRWARVWRIRPLDSYPRTSWYTSQPHPSLAGISALDEDLWEWEFLLLHRDLGLLEAPWRTDGQSE